MSVLYGIHDQEGAALVPPGGWCIALVSLSENAAGVDYSAIRPDIHWLVRVNWGYGSTGTIPLPTMTNNYLTALGNFISHSKGIYGVIIGNEPNHPQERPDGVYITPQHYVQFFTQAKDLVKKLAPQVKVGPAAVAPYRLDNQQRWNDYLTEILTLIGEKGGCDFITAHAYLRSSRPADVFDQNLRMGAPLMGQYSGFLTYENALSAIPNGMKELPVHITEVAPLLENGWEDANTGVIQAVYREIEGWNESMPNPLIHSVSIYRFPKYDKWSFADKMGVIADFKAAVAHNYQSPYSRITPPPPTTPVLPQEQIPSQIDFDPRAKARGVVVKSIPTSSNSPLWLVKKVQWFNEEEADRIGPDRHFLFDTLDENGNRLAGVEIAIVWPSGASIIRSEEKKGEKFSANYPMSPSRNEFSAMVRQDGVSSETVSGVGMGMDTPSGFNPGIHTSTFVVFQRVAAVKEGPIPVPEPTKPPIKTPVPPLFTPIPADMVPVITQRFGPSEIKYGNLKGHTGIDFAVAVGTNVYAADSGVVQEAGTLPDYGNYVKLSHKWGESLYAHLDSFWVTHGEHIVQGGLIARSGNSGNSTGPHLHFAIRINPYNRGDGWDGFSDPMPFLFRKEGPQTKVSVVAIISGVASEFGIERELFLSIAWAESSFNYRVNADGLFQVSDAVWQDYAATLGAKDKLNPEDNTRVAAAYLKWLLTRYKGDVWKALYAYNWGPGNVDGGGTPPTETLNYATKIIHGRDLLKALGR